MESLSPYRIGAAEHFPIVCLCGSAGGLSAYLEILSHLSVTTGMAFIAISHRGIRSPHFLLPLLASTTTMSVAEIVQGTPIQPNCVLLSPPHMQMSTDGITLQLRQESNPRGWPTTISFFLRSLARLSGSRAIAIILSGMGNDGSAALRAVNRSGGMIIAQSNPLFSEMADHAIDTGYVNLILSPREIGLYLSRMTPHGGRLEGSEKVFPLLSMERCA